MPVRTSSAAPFVVVAAPGAPGVVAGVALLVGALLTGGCAGRDPKNIDGGLVASGEGEGEGDPLPPECLEETNRPPAAGPGAIYFGTRTPTLAPLTASQVNAVVAISDDNTEGAFCSGTLISPDVVLTAVHCTTGTIPGHLRVLFGENDLDPVLVMNVVQKHETDADTDVAMLKLDHAPTLAGDGIDVTPIPIAIDPPSQDDVGVLLENAGFGENEDGGFSGRFFVTERFDGFDDKFIQVNGEGSRGVCFGDSGGPSLRITPDGDVRVLGALSFGDSACMNVDNYGRADAIRDIIETFTGPTPAAVPVACPSDVTEQGACNVEQALATYCEAGVVQHDLCAPGDICGADASGNARCISTADNACGAITSYGECDGADADHPAPEILKWCDNGVVRQRDCSICDERCVLSSPAEGYACVPSDCGDLDRTGACDGNTSEWCDTRGQKQTEDCAAEGTTCEFLGEQLGFYCLDQTACQGLDFLGECDGTVLNWCEDNEVQSVDCADTGGTCIHVDDATGFDCSQ